MGHPERAINLSRIHLADRENCVRETRPGFEFTRAALECAAVVLVLVLSASTAQTHSATPDVREQAWSVLRDGLTNGHASHRRVAAQALSLMQGNRTAERLAVHALKDSDVNVRAAAAVTLGQLRARK